MRQVLFIGVVASVSSQSLAQATDKSPQYQPSHLSRGVATIDFSSASGKPLGSVTEIAGTTYYFGADGTMLGTSTIVKGRRIFRSY